MAKTITARTLAGYSRTKMNIVYVENLVKKLRQEGEYKGYNTTKEIQDKFELEGKELKFTAVVGNPPYQEDTDNNRDTPVYHLFMEESYKLADKVSLITPARFLFNAGQTPGAWNQKMLQDDHLKVVFFEQKSANVFPNTDIKGGVAITYRDTDKSFGAIGAFIAQEELSAILQKVMSKSFEPISSIHYGNSSYKLTEKVYKDFPDFIDRVSSAERTSIGSNIFERFSEMFIDEKPKTSDDYIKVFGRQDNQRVIKWTKREYVSSHPNLDKWKVFVAGANGTGTLGEALSTPFVSEPPTAGTQTFISFGAFSDEIEAANVLKYLKTKTARTLLATRKVTQNNKTKSVWENVPLLDFTDESDINWSHTIADIDKQLYAKYDLNGDEITFIETHVKAME